MTDYLRLLRPRQWLKNVFIFAGLIFSRHFLDPASIIDSALAFIIFSLLSSSGYIFNDIIDRKHDAVHPSKSKRPIAAGAIQPAAAGVIAAALLLCSLVAAFLLERSFFHVCGVYVVCMVLYSTAIKHVMLLDVLFVAFGYVLRAIAGAVAIEVEISSWLLVCTLLIALFLAVAKRRTELVMLGPNATRHRRIFADYSLPLLDQMIAAISASCIVAYCLYTLAPDTVAKFGTKNLVFTVPFVIYGLFRYMYITYQERHAGSPERVLFRDLPLQACLLGWILVCVLILITA